MLGLVWQFADEVVPLLWILPQVVEFFPGLAFVVADIAPLLGADGCVARQEVDDGRMLPRHVRILQQGCNVNAIQVGRHGKPTKPDQGGIETGQVDRPARPAACFGHPGNGHSEGHVGGALPQGVLGEMILFAKGVTMIGPEYDDRVVAVSALVERLHEEPDQGIGVGNASKVGLHTPA